MYELNHKMMGHARTDKDQWHKLRVLASILLSPHAKKGKKIKPEDLIVLSDEVKKADMSKEDIQADVNRKLKAYKKHKAS